MKQKLLCMLIAAAAAHASAQVTDAMITGTETDTSNVLSWGMGTQGQRYSSLATINTGNVKNLVPAWSMSFGGEKQRGQETQPLVYNGVLFAHLCN